MTIQNTFTYTVQSTPIAVDIDFGALLAQAGWTTRTAGTDVSLRGFTLDVDSIRVVEYASGFSPGPKDGSRTQPTPAVFYPAQFHAAKHKDFDPARNPAGTVVFELKEPLKPNERRYYYIYANPLEYGKTPPAQFTLPERAPLDGYLFSTSGTTTYGFEPQQVGSEHRVHVTQASCCFKTHVELYIYSVGRFVLAPPTEAFPNPRDIQGNCFPRCHPGTVDFFVPANTPFKIASDTPVIVEATGTWTPPLNAQGGAGLPGVKEAATFVPSNANQSYAGRTFNVYGYRDGFGQDTSAVTVIKASPTGRVTVQASDAAGSSSTRSVELSLTDPITNLELRKGWNVIEAEGGDILVSHAPVYARTDAPFPAMTIPAVSGAAVGDDFLASIPQDGGYLRICPAGGNVSIYAVATNRPSMGLVPEGPVGSTPPLVLTPSAGCYQYDASASTPVDDYIEIYSVRPEGASVTDKPGIFTVFAGALERSDASLNRGMVGNYGGRGAVDFWTTGDIGVFGYFNDTRVTITVQKEHQNVRSFVTQSPFSVSEDGYQVVSPSRYPESTGLLHVTSDKPIAVVSLAEANVQYEHFIPGRPMPPQTTVGAAEFRGPLVELHSREKEGRQDFRSTGPGTAVTFPLEVLNLGHWQAKENLPDTIHITCTGPDGWAVQGCAKDVPLASGTAQRLDVSITPPSEAVNVSGTFIVEARSAHSPTVTSTFKLIVFVEIRYGVGMWFDVEGGRKTIDPPIGVSPGETYKYNVIIKNTGSAKDKFDVKTEDARPGWSQALLLDGESVTTVALDGGESKVLTFTVTAPDQDTAFPNLVRIDAISESSALAADVVYTATRIRPKVSIGLELAPTARVAEPNQTVVFNVTINNSGNAYFAIGISSEGLPSGWQGNLSTENIGNEISLGPAQNWTIQYSVRPPAGAAAGDSAKPLIRARVNESGKVEGSGEDAVTAVVVVKKIHNITLPALNDARAEPGATFDYVLPLTNHGNGNDIVELLPGAVTPVWRVVTPNSLALDPEATEDLPLSVTVPNGTLPGLYNLTFTLRLTREAFQNLTIPVQVVPTARVAYHGVENGLAMTPGRAKQLDLTAANVGNVAGTFEFNATAPAGWNVTFSPARAKLAPGESVPLLVLLNATREATDGAYPLTLTATLSGAAAGVTDAPVRIARPELYLTNVTTAGSTSPGDLVLVTAMVGNRGAIAAENVSVELLVDGSAVDKVVISRILVNDTKVATLNWLSTKRTSDIKVVLDRQGEIVELSRDDHEATANFASPVPGVGTVGLLGVVLLVALGRLRRGSRGPAGPEAPEDDAERPRAPRATRDLGSGPRSGPNGGRDPP